MSLVKKAVDEYLRERTKQLSYARARQPQTYLGPTLFPNIGTDKLKFEYLKGARNRPVAATVQAYGAEATIASRRGFSQISGKIPAIKRKIPLDGETMMLLKSLNPSDEATVINELFNDLDAMVDAVQARVELMRMEAITTGKVVLQENGVIAEADYGVPANHKEALSGTDLFSDTENSKPLDVIRDWSDTVYNDTGIRPERALTCNRIVSLLCQNKQIRQAINGDNGSQVPVTLPKLNQLLESLGLPKIATYEERIDVEDPESGELSTVRAFDNNENKFVLLPMQSLGNTLWGPTEEATVSDYIDQKSVAGLWAGSYLLSHDPVAIETKASASAFPTFPMADSIFIGTVR